MRPQMHHRSDVPQCLSVFPSDADPLVVPVFEKPTGLESQRQKLGFCPRFTRNRSSKLTNLFDKSVRGPTISQAHVVLETSSRLFIQYVKTNINCVRISFCGRNKNVATNTGFYHFRGKSTVPTSCWGIFILLCPTKFGRRPLAWNLPTKLALLPECLTVWWKA